MLHWLWATLLSMRNFLMRNSLKCVSLHVLRQPNSWPAHTWRFPTDLIMFSFNVWTTTLSMILLITLPTPTGRSPGFLSKNIQENSVWFNSTHNVFPTLVRAIHISVELWPKLLDVSILLQPLASIPKGTEPPLVRRAVFQTTSASMHSYLCYVWILVYRRIKNVYQPHFDMCVFALKG